MRTDRLLQHANEALGSSEFASAAALTAITPDAGAIPDHERSLVEFPVTGVSPDPDDSTLNLLYAQPDGDPPLTLGGLVRMLTGMPPSFLVYHLFVSRFIETSADEGADIDTPVYAIFWDKERNVFSVVPRYEGCESDF